MAEQLGNNETGTKQQNGDGVHDQILESADVRLKSSLLVVVGEPFNVEQKDLILERIVIELSAWDVDQSKCDLNQQLSSSPAFQSANQEAEKKFEHESPELQATILINPSLESTVATVTDFLTRPSSYKYLLHSGPALLNNGAWLLHDGAFTFHHFQEVVKKLDLQGGEGSVVVDVSLVEKFADWNDALLSKLAPKLKLRLLRPATSLKDESGLIKFSDNISTYLKPFSVADRMKPADSIGSLNFEQPTCYIFPAGQGTSLVFGIEGFTMLIDGGYKRSCTFWEFVRHLNRIDCMMISRLTYDNIFGLLSFFEKKSTDKGGPDVGVVMLNVGDTRHKTPNPVASNNNGASGHTTSGLIVSIAEEGRLLAEHMSITHLALPQPIIGSAVHPISLYYKVGHGSLDMYVISPTHDSKELKDFLNQWSKMVDSYKGGIPLADHLSVSFALLWKPAAHLKQTCMRMLYPGHLTNQKLIEGLDKLKNVVEFASLLGHAQEKVAKKPPTFSGAAASNANKPKVGGTKPGQQPISNKQDGKKADAASVGKTPSISSLDHKVNDAKKQQDTAKKPAPIKKPTTAAAADANQKAAGASKISPTPTSKQPPTSTSAPTTAATTPSPQKSPTKTAPKMTSAAGAKTPTTGPKTPKSSDKKADEKKSAGTAHPTKVPHGITATSTPLKQQHNKSKQEASKEDASVATACMKAEEKVMETKEVSSKCELEEQKLLVLGGTDVQSSSPTEDQRAHEHQQHEQQHEEASEQQVPGAQEETTEQQQSLPSSSPVKPNDEGQQQQEFDPQREWDRPEGLPTPIKPEASNVDQQQQKTTDVVGQKSPDKSKKLIIATDKGTSKRPITAPEKLNTTLKDDTAKSNAAQQGQKKIKSEAASKAVENKNEINKKPSKPVVGFYVDLTYIPNHPDVDFFRKVRSKYYVLSSAFPDAKLIDNLIEARASWDDNQSEVSIVPTHDTNVLRDWLKNKADRLIGAKIVITPPASRCAIQLQEQDAGFNAFRVQF